MTDNVVEFPGSKPGETKDAPITADEALKMCEGKFTDVIVLGIKDGRAQCVSTVAVDEAIYELSRAIHILHNYIDRM